MSALWNKNTFASIMHLAPALSIAVLLLAGYSKASPSVSTLCIHSMEGTVDDKWTQ